MLCFKTKNTLKYSLAHLSRFSLAQGHLKLKKKMVQFTSLFPMLCLVFGVCELVRALQRVLGVPKIEVGQPHTNTVF